MLEIDLVPCLRDNYAYLVRDLATGLTAAVDPSESAPVLKAAAAKGWTISHVMNTHHHPDHVGGNLAIKEATGCVIVAPRPDEGRIPGIDIAIEDGGRFSLGDSLALAIFIPGHTRGHMAYWFEESKAVFCGDTLFALGCGRLFEGTPEQMWRSLERLRRLPGDTRVYCGHEYTQANARFALTVDGANAALALRAKAIDGLRAQGRPTVPSTMAEEAATNPFMRADDPVLAAAMGLPAAGPVAVFAEIRRRKDAF